MPSRLQDYRVSVSFVIVQPCLGYCPPIGPRWALSPPVFRDAKKSKIVSRLREHEGTSCYLRVVPTLDTMMYRDTGRWCYGGSDFLVHLVFFVWFVIFVIANYFVAERLFRRYFCFMGVL